MIPTRVTDDHLPGYRTRARVRVPRPGGRRGAAVVELAMIMPFLIIVVLGVCELGQAIYVNACLSEAARIGCETGSRPGACNADVISDVNAALTEHALPTAFATITVNVNDNASEVAAARRNDKITVTVAVPTSKVSWTGSFTYTKSDSVQSQSGTMLKQG